MQKKDNSLVLCNCLPVPPLVNYVLLYLITGYKNMHPNAHVNMLVCNTGAAEKRILNRQVNLGFVEAEVSNELIKATPCSKMNLYLSPE